MSRPREATADDVRSALEEARAAGSIETVRWRDVRFERFKDDYQGIRRGTIVTGDRVVPSYPPIGRIFVLRKGLTRAFRGRFEMEEKVNGFNVRVVRLGDAIVALTRGGFVCPFSTARLADLLDLSVLLDDLPEAVLCGEIAGPGNPYIKGAPPHVEEDVRFFGFDFLDARSGEPVPLRRRDQLFERYEIPTVPRYGTFEVAQLDPVVERMRELHDRQCEGAIFKPIGKGVRVKYVTPASSANEIASEGALLAELPPQYYVNRILRLALAVKDLGVEGDLSNLEPRVGHAMVTGLLDSAAGAAVNHAVYQDYLCILPDDESADELIAHLDRASRKIQVRELHREVVGGRTHVTFRKTFHRATARLSTLLDGAVVFD